VRKVEYEKLGADVVQINESEEMRKGQKINRLYPHVRISIGLCDLFIIRCRCMMHNQTKRRVDLPMQAR